MSHAGANEQGQLMSARSLHPFPARMAPDIATDWLTSNNKEGLTILDPMCGSGTVLTAAGTNGHTAIGLDMDPLAVLISSVAVAPLDVTEFVAAGARTVAAARKARDGSPPWEDTETDEFARYWFGEAQRVALAKLSSAIRSEPDDSIRRALFVALSRIIITKSPRASLAADTSHSRPHRVVEVSTYDAFEGYALSLRQVARHLSGRPPIAKNAHVSLGDARVMASVLDQSIDATITSPPYLNAIDYMRGHKMSLIWMGYSVSRLRGIRSGSIGSEKGLATKSSSLENDLVARMIASAQSPKTMPTRIISRYASDVVQFSNALGRVVRPGGTAVLVVGNSSVRGNYIRNDTLIEEALSSSGFSTIHRAERVIPENRRYLPLTRSAESSLGARMRSEVVLSFRRAA